MKVLIVNTLYPPFIKGGAERSVSQIAEQLCESGHTVEVVTLSPDKHYSEEINRVKVNRWPVYNFYSVFDYTSKKPSFAKKLLWQFIDLFNPLVYRRFKRQLKNSKPDVVWTNNLSGFGLAIWWAAHKFNIPVVHTTRDFYLLSNNVTLFDEKTGQTKRSGALGFLKRLFFKASRNTVFSFIGISHSIRDIHVDTLNINTRHSPFRVVYNSVDASVKQDLKQENSRKIYGYIGQFSRAKGIYALLTQFKATSINCFLYIAADVSEEVKQQFKDDRIVFLGFTKPSDFFAKIDVLLVPSLWLEPFGRVIIEAMVHATPVVCSGKGGLNELSTLFHSVHIGCFAQGLTQTLQQDYVFDERDYQTVTTQFQPKTIAAQYEREFYKASDAHHG